MCTGQLHRLKLVCFEPVLLAAAYSSLRRLRWNSGWFECGPWASLGIPGPWALGLTGCLRFVTADARSAGDEHAGRERS